VRDVLWLLKRVYNNLETQRAEYENGKAASHLAFLEADAALAVEEVSPEIASTIGVIETDERGARDGHHREAGRSVVDARHNRVLRASRRHVSRLCATPAVGRGRVSVERGWGCWYVLGTVLKPSGSVSA
jgi:hypothetical protein